MSLHSAFKSDTAATPDYTTMLESVHPGGVAWGVKRGEVWLYRTLPLHPVSDLKSSDGLHTAAAALASAFDGLAAVSKNQMNKRSMSKDGYRSWQLLITNVPRLYRPPAASPLYGLLTEHMGGRVVPRRQVLFGVRLESDFGFRGARSITDYARAAIENLTAEPTLERYETDRIRIAGILDRAGMTVPTGDEFARADSWWNLERHNLTPFLPHSDHLHVFDSTRALQMAEQAGYDNCRDWTPQTVPGCIDLTFATLAEMEVDGVDVTSQQALWLQDLLAMNALAVSVRGKVEPMKVTRDVIRSQIRKWENDEIEKAKVGKRSRAEQFDIVQETKALEELYASKDSPATLYDTSVIVALDGQGIDLEAASANSLFRLAVMEARQAPAFLETMVCSTSAQNPRRHQWPVHTLAYAGAAGLSQAGDTDEPRALLGFTEHDRQPVGVSPIASSRADAAPLFAVSGATGAGKTLLLQWLAAQFAETPTSRGEMTPVVVINPKAGSDLSGVVEWVRQRTGQGQVANLDDLLSADGVFDPIRFSRNPEVGLELALDAILSMNPFGPSRLAYELPLTNALRVGISAGGTCIGEALELAAARGADAEMVRQVFELTDSIPKARAIIGRRPGGSSLSVAGGITLIQVGDTELNLAEGSSDPLLAQRVDMTLLRLMVQGSAAALAHRDGVVMFDEAWVFAKGAGDAIQALGRTAREMRVMMMMFNQRPSELLSAGMENYVSRSMIMALPPAEAEAACQIAGLEPTPDRVRRLAAESGWNSMRAIISDDRRVLRGTVGTYVGLDGRPVNVEVTIPPAFFKVASTNAAEKGDRPLTV